MIKPKILPKILIVDDVPRNIQLAANILKKGNFNISYATDGIQALDKIEKIDFDLILLDIMMPDLDGIEVCKLIKESPHISHIPVIFLTAKTEADSVSKGFEVGGADYITKPFNSDELLARVKTHVKIKQKSDQLTIANATTNKLFSIIAHDLRGLMGNVKNIFELLTNDYYTFKPERVAKLLKIGKDSSASTFNLLENLLCWTRTKDGKIISRPKDTSLQFVVQEITNLFSASMTHKELEFKVIDLDESVKAFIDEDLFRTILRNLVSNAIKFSPVGSEIVLSVEQNDAQGIVVFKVIDHGVGMDKESLENIQSKEFSLGEEGTAGEKGTGLGLPLVFNFIEIMKARIEVESDVGKGTSFIISLPMYDFMKFGEIELKELNQP